MSKNVLYSFAFMLLQAKNLHELGRKESLTVGEWHSGEARYAGAEGAKRQLPSISQAKGQRIYLF